MKTSASPLLLAWRRNLSCADLTQVIYQALVLRLESGRCSLNIIGSI